MQGQTSPLILILNNTEIDLKSPSTLITDSFLQSIGPNMIEMTLLSLVGCTKVTHGGIWAMISSSVHTLETLGLESVSPALVRSWSTSLT